MPSVSCEAVLIATDGSYLRKDWITAKIENIKRLKNKVAIIPLALEKKNLLNKERIDRLRALAASALEEALGFFEEAGDAHMEIEKIFSSAMNFAEKEAYSRDLCDKIRKGDL